MQVQTVQTKQDLDAFIRLPYHNYKDDPLWVEPLLTEIRGQFNPTTNPLLDHCEYQLFLLKELDNPAPSGRLLY